jgi:aminoethylphosphonate catabolism LysR family transcriptional regulator
MAITFTALRSFSAVAKAQNFSAAARVLRVGQPTLWKQITDIEDEYRVELFVRTGRSLRLTEAGIRLHEIARRVVQLREEAHEQLDMHGNVDRGHFRLAAVGPRRATDLLAALKERYPNVQISVLLGNSEISIQRLFNLDADVAIVAQTIKDDRLNFIHFRTDRVVFIVNKNHPWARRKSIRLSEVSGQPFVLREEGSTTRTALQLALKKARVSISPVFEISSREGVSRAVGYGFGIGAVADFEFSPHSNLHAIEIKDFPIRINYYIAHLAERENSPKIRAFIEIVRGKMT